MLESKQVPAPPIFAAQINAQFLEAKSDYFVDVQLWPTAAAFNVREWLSNFHDSEKDHAIHLLNSFIYFSEALCDQLFIVAVQGLSSKIYRNDKPFRAAQQEWRTFLANSIFTYATGETPHPTDSGVTFARKARQVLKIEESQIYEPQLAIGEAMRTGRPVIFVDDFVGSGSQFIETWKREYDTHGSFKRLAENKPNQFYYCPLVCTEYGAGNIAEACKQVQLSPAHFLPSHYSAYHANSVVWPENLKATARKFLDDTSARAGIPVNKQQGFKNLGLSLAFSHSVPDATIPLFYSEDAGWKPLIRRT